MQDKRRISICEKNEQKKLMAAQLLLDADVKHKDETEDSDSSVKIVYKKKKVLKKKNHKKKILFLSDSESESSESDHSSIERAAHKKKSTKYIKSRNDKISVNRPSMYKKKNIENIDHFFS